MKNDLIAYSASMSAYLLERLDNIRSIILFGSASRGDATSASDVDIFIDTVSGSKKQINKIIDAFHHSQNHKNWSMKGVKNQFSVIIGDLESREWSDLKRSIITDGIVLFGKYKSKPEKLKHHMLFSYYNIEDAKRRVKLHRKLFGYKLGKREYTGIVIKINGIRHGKGTFSVPIEHYKEINEIFKELKITPEITEIWIG